MEHLWHKYAAVDVATLRSFFKTKLPWKQCKRGGAWGDMGVPLSAS